MRQAARFITQDKNGGAVRFLFPLSFRVSSVTKWSPPTQFCWELSTVLLTKEWTKSAITVRFRQAFPKDGRPRWLTPFIQRMLESFPDPPSFEGLVRFVEQDIWQRRPDFWTQVRPLQLLGIVELQPQFASHPSIVLREPIPAFATSRNLADWLGVSLGQLDWFADCHGQERNRSYEALRHYSYQWIPRKVGSSRLLESPKR